MSKPHTHESHPAIINRLKRAKGHLSKVIEMIEAGRPCLDLAQQLQAVESAVSNAKQTLIHDHLDHCLDAVAGADRPASAEELEEFKKITRYL